MPVAENSDLSLRDTSRGYESIKEAVTSILVGVGENPNREGLVKTPGRVARMYMELLAGYFADPADVINGAMFDPEGVTYQEMIVVTGIDFSSLCEHHLLPFIGQAHIAYIPSERVVGLSKIPRVVEMFSRRLQLQERMTQQIANMLTESLDPLGVGVVVDGVHSCASMRGIKKANARMTTSAMTGVFKESDRTRAEFLEHIRRSSAS
jgi:GTP cyclohydrolase IA